MNAGRLLLLVAVCAVWVGTQSCVTDNEAAYDDILGPEKRPLNGPAAPSGGTAGTGSGGAPSGGTPVSTGGTVGGDSGVGGGGAGALGGSDGGGEATTGGSSDNPPVDPNYSPACFESLTQSGEEILKGTPCTPEDPPVCYRPCGPNQVGWKTETCLAGVYAEGDCTFPPDKDYSCYAIPDPIDEVACGVTAPPKATDECSAPLCMSCNFGGSYQDSGDNAKDGFCTCREPDQEGIRRWTCASDVAWPCPFNQGC